MKSYKRSKSKRRSKKSNKRRISKRRSNRRSKSKVKKSIDGMTSFEKFQETYLASERYPCTRLYQGNKNLLMMAIITDNPEIVNYVINLCDKTIIKLIIQKDVKENTVLAYACNTKDFTIFKMIYDLYMSKNLINSINKKNIDDITPFMYSVIANNFNIIKFLLKNNRSNIKIDQLDDERNNAIMYTRDYETIRLLVENGSKINTENIEGKILIVNIILSSINIEEKYKIIDYLLENGANIRNSEGINLLMFASKALDIEMIKFLQGKRLMDINEQDNEGNTALIHVIRNKKIPRYDVIKLLLDLGADYTIVNNNGQTFMSIGNKKFPDFEKKIKEIKRLRDIEYISHLYLKSQDNDEYTDLFNEYISTVQDPDNIFKEIMKFR